MKMISCVLLLVLTLSTLFSAEDPKQAAKELIQLEQQFATTVANKGIKAGFLLYLAPDSIVFQPTPVAARVWYEMEPDPAIWLEWKPNYVESAQGSDLGFTTGPWQIKKSREENKAVQFGHFVTLWARQPDGSWKVALDAGVSYEKPPRLELSSTIEPKIGTPAWRPRPGMESSPPGSDLTGLDLQMSGERNAAKWASRYLAMTSPELRFYRQGRYPVLGRDEAKKALEDNPETRLWKPEKTRLSALGDLGYTCGQTTGQIWTPKGIQQETGSYLHIWKRQKDGQWCLLLDLVSPISKPER
jgi:ketosteroid isomerase-like protein